MLTDFIINNEIAALEAAYLTDLTLTAELDRIEKVFEIISQKLTELLTELN